MKKSSKNSRDLRITWTPCQPDADYSARRGIDQHGNRYFEPANRECVSCKLYDGRSGMGWTAEAAFAAAQTGVIAFLDIDDPAEVRP